jgi:hypothetical protein
LKILSMAADGTTDRDRQAHVTKIIVPFCNFAKAHKKKTIVP